MLIESEIDAKADFVKKIFPSSPPPSLPMLLTLEARCMGGISGVAGTVTSQSQSQRGTTRNPVFLMINFGNYNQYA